MARLACALLGTVLALSLPASATTIEAPGPAGPLQATLLRAPVGGAPVVLIIPGSGPTDRDGNNPLGVKAATYRLLAEDLVANGVTTARIDKRGMFGSQQAVPDPNAVTIEDYAADVHGWVAALRTETDTPCIWLLGHSEGGLVALKAAEQPTGICGLILIAAAGRPLGVVMREQLKANPANAPILDEALAAIDTLETGRHVDLSRLNPALHPLFAPQVQDFLISAFALDPAELIAGIGSPILILQGRRDIQIDVEDAQRLHAANPRAKLVLLADTNHVLKRVASDDRAANIATYADPDLPLAPGVVDAIAQFIKAAPAP